MKFLFKHFVQTKSGRAPANAFFKKRVHYISYKQVYAYCIVNFEELNSEDYS